MFETIDKFDLQKRVTKCLEFILENTSWMRALFPKNTIMD